MRKKNKIAVIGLKGLPAFGGAATVGENIIEQLKDKYDFTVYATSSHTNLTTGNYNGYKQIVFKKFFLPQLNPLYYYVVSALHSIIFGKFDLVHVHHRDAAFIIPILKIKYKTILTIHGFGTADLSDKWNRFKMYYHIQEKYFVKKADIITTMSLEDKNIIEQKLNVKVKYIPNGIALKKLKKVTIKSDESDYIMFAAGRIVSFKRCDVFLSALNKIQYKGQIFIAGDLDQSLQYKDKIIKLSEGLNVNFKGLIHEKELLMKYYANAKVFVFPSSREAMSMVLLEVASVNTPLICSSIPGNRNVFNDDEVLYFDTDDVNDLAEKIEWALSNSKKMGKKADNAYQKLSRYYLWENISMEYKEIYNELAGNVN
jgi:glycosyltransferase involved in cell wall biosynthesis